jgi:hypothetical protein
LPQIPQTTYISVNYIQDRPHLDSFTLPGSSLKAR